MVFRKFKESLFFKIHLMRHTFQKHFGASGLQRMELLKGNKLFLVHFSEAAPKFPTTTPGRLRELRHVENKCNRAIFRTLCTGVTG